MTRSRDFNGHILPPPGRSSLLLSAATRYERHTWSRDSHRCAVDPRPRGGQERAFRHGTYTSPRDGRERALTGIDGSGNPGTVLYWSCLYAISSRADLDDGDGVGPERGGGRGGPIGARARAGLQRERPNSRMHGAVERPGGAGACCGACEPRRIEEERHGRACRFAAWRTVRRAQATRPPMAWPCRPARADRFSRTREARDTLQVLHGGATGATSTTAGPATRVVPRQRPRWAGVHERSVAARRDRASRPDQPSSEELLRERPRLQVKATRQAGHAHQGHSHRRN